MRGIIETAVMTAALLVATTWSTGPAAASMVNGLASSARASVDLKRLPLGDGKVATSAMVGSVWACQASFNGGAAFTDGPGIAADDQPRVFERFWRADPSRVHRTGGTGLGLAIVASLVQAHGGTIRLVSEPGHGTAFTVRLPLAE